MMSYIVSWFFWLYFILSRDETFPSDDEVKGALKDPRDEKAQAVLDQCGRLIFFQPATTLQGLPPGILDRWDQAYTRHIPNFEGTQLCDLSDKVWQRGWKAYAEQVVEDLVQLGNSSSYVKLPRRASARLRYFLSELASRHNGSIFPTKTFLQDVAKMFSTVKEAFCDVSGIYIYLYLTKGMSWAFRTRPRATR